LPPVITSTLESPEKVPMPCSRLFASVALLALVSVAPASAQRRRAGGGGASATPAPLKGVVISFHGTLQSVSKKTILLASDDDNHLVTLRRTSKTSFFSGDQQIKASDVSADDKVTIDATEDNDLKFLAVTVRLDPSQPPKKDRTLITR